MRGRNAPHWTIIVLLGSVKTKQKKTNNKQKILKNPLRQAKVDLVTSNTVLLYPNLNKVLRIETNNHTPRLI